MQFEGLIFYGFFIHIIFILSIFDIYFKTPIAQGIAPVNNELVAPAKRVVLISADGLRLDGLFERFPDTEELVTSNIKRIIETRGLFGVSEAHLPTESRPGHVALIAGFYEDPSAVTKGWKHNTVDFDSLFNKSKCAFAWGAPDIVNIFTSGLNKDCVYADVFGSQQQFSGDTTKYDDWVYKKVSSFLKNSGSDVNWLHGDKTFFFLHLLGLDTSGHTHKPHTELYRNTLKNVDNLVIDIENLFSNFYEDGRTAFIFTSDHGMTDWGSHGAGDLTETLTPFLAWGAGIKKPPERSSLRRWTLQDIDLKNISQADVTPLVAVLLGIPIPVNSVGHIPLSYFDATEEFKAEASLLNARQMVAQFERKLELTRDNSFSIFYKPFGKLNNEQIGLRIGKIKSLIFHGEYNAANERSDELFYLSMEGVDYFQNYYQRPLFVLLTISYILWILILMLRLSSNLHYNPIAYGFVLGNIIFLSSVIFSVLMLALQKMPYMYYFYFLLPQCLLLVLATNLNLLKDFYQKINNWRLNIFLALIFVIGVEIIVASFFHRWLISVSMLTIMIWSIYSLKNVKVNSLLFAMWIISCLCLAIFPLLPVIGKKPKIYQVSISGALCFLMLSTILYLINRRRTSNFTDKVVSSVGLALVALATVTSAAVHYYFDAHNELNIYSQVISWSLWVVSCFIPFASSRKLFDRLLNIFLALLVPFLLMSVNHEGFFILSLIINLFCWLYIEFILVKQNSYFENNILDISFNFKSKTPKVLLSVEDYRRAYIFLCYIFLAFFGIGNIASLNSFDPVWVRCFLTTFSPFAMSALILFKTVIPFLAVTCAFKALTVVLNVEVQKIFLIVLVFCNIMGLNFLYLVTNTGSWLDIGTSISHYIIQQTTVLFLVLLYGISQVLTTWSVFSRFRRSPGSTDTQGTSLGNVYFTLQYDKLHHS